MHLQSVNLNFKESYMAKNAPASKGPASKSKDSGKDTKKTSGSAASSAKSSAKPKKK
jgi:hypothetical protein